MEASKAVKAAAFKLSTYKSEEVPLDAVNVAMEADPRFATKICDEEATSVETKADDVAYRLPTLKIPD